MTRRPRTVSGTAGPGLIGVRLVPTVLLADADAGSCAMVRDALLEGVGPTDLRTVESADELDDYLHQRGEHTDGRTSPPPTLILVDVDLPGNEDLDAVRAIKSNADLRRIPVVVLGAYDDDPRRSRPPTRRARTPYIVKPVTFLALVRLMKVFTAYWLETAELPPGEAA